MGSTSRRDSRRHPAYPSFSLAHRVLLCVVPLALLGIFASTFPLYLAAKTQILRDVGRQVDGYATVAAHSLQGYFRHRNDELDAVAEAPLFQDYYRNKEYGLREEADAYRDELAAYLRTFQLRTQAYDLIQFRDASGEIVAETRAAGDVEDPASDVFIDIRALPKGKRLQGGILRTRGAQHSTWLIGKPVHDARGGFRGAVLMLCGLEPVEKTLADHQAGKNGAAALIDASGTILAGRPGPSGESALDAVHPVEGTPWRVRASARMQDFIGPLQRIRNLTIWLCVACAMGVMIPLFLRVRSLTAPIKELEEASRRFGEGDLAHRVAVRGSDEIAALARRFNAMASGLEERTGDLESRLRQLSSLKALGDAVTHRLSGEEIGRLCLNAAARGLGFDRGAVYLVDEEAGALKGVCAFNTEDVGITDRALARDIIPLDSSHVFSCSVRERRAVNIRDPAADPRCAAPLIKQSHIEAFCAAPILAEDRVYGLIVVDRNDSKTAIDDEDMSALALFCGAAGLAFKNRELFENIRLSETRYRSVVDSSADAIIGLSSDLRVTVWNRGARTIFGRPQEEMLGKTIELLFQPGDYRRLVRLALEKSPLVNFEIRGRSRDGKALELSLTWAGSGGGAAPQEWSLVIRDVTAEKALRSHLVQAEKLSLTGQLLSGVAHELNNPLNNVIGYADILRESEAAPGLPERVRADLDEIADSARRCAAIVDNLLLFVRKPRGPKTAVSLRTAVHETLHLLKYSLEKQEDIRVGVYVARGLPRVRGNLQQLEQAFINIVQNACRAMRGQTRDKRIELMCRQEGNNVVLMIGDSGPGVPPAERDKIFEPFYTTRDDGTGLGLAICAQIVRDHDGTLECGASPFGGALLRIRLPVFSGAARSPKAPRLPPPVRGKRVLVVEDESAALSWIERVLTDEGHAVATARTGKQALRKLRSGAYDLLITDLHLGGKDGRGVLTAALGITAPPAMLLVTGDVLNMAIPPGHPLENIPALPKPFTLVDFRTAVRRALRPKRGSKS